MPAISILFPDRPSSRRSVIGCREDLSPAVTPTVRHMPDGTPIVLPTSFPTKWRVSLSAAGRRVEIPHADLRVGERIVIDSSVWWRSRVEAGAMIVGVPREPARAILRHPRVDVDYDAVWGHHPDFRFAVSAQIPRQFNNVWDALDVHYRPRLHCIVTSISWSGSASDRDQGWTIEAEEEHAWQA